MRHRHRSKPGSPNQAVGRQPKDRPSPPPFMARVIGLSRPYRDLGLARVSGQLARGIGLMARGIGLMAGRKGQAWRNTSF